MAKASRKVNGATALGAQPMVVVRFNEQVDVPYEDDVHARFDELKLSPWRRLEERFGKLALKRMVTALKPEQITELQTRAMRLDPTYRPARFTSFFYVDAPADA